MNPKIHLTVAAIIEKNGQYLLVEEISDGKKVINQPAGHWEPGENHIEAVCRETLEETAYCFKPNHIVGIHTWVKADSNDTYLRISFSGSLGEQDINRKLDKDIIRTLWLTRREIEQASLQLRSPLVLRSIKDYESGIQYDVNLINSITM